MEKITTIDRNKCIVLRDELDTVVSEIAQKYGLHVELGRGSFSATNFNLKVEFSVIENGNAITRKVKDFKELATIYGLEATDLGKEFVFKSHKYVVTGVNSKSWQYPIIARREDGRSYKFKAEHVKKMLKS